MERHLGTAFFQRPREVSYLCNNWKMEGRHPGLLIAVLGFWAILCPHTSGRPEPFVFSSSISTSAQASSCLVCACIRQGSTRRTDPAGARDQGIHCKESGHEVAEGN